MKNFPERKKLNLASVAEDFLKTWNDEKTFDAGYDDGYATGYNTQCQIRSTMIYGHFDSEEYSQGYNIGKYDGAQACIVDRKNNNVR